VSVAPPCDLFPVRPKCPSCAPQCCFSFCKSRWSWYLVCAAEEQETHGAALMWLKFAGATAAIAEALGMAVVSCSTGSAVSSKCHVFCMRWVCGQDDGLMLMGTWCKKLQVLRLGVCSQGLSGRGVTAVLLGCGRNVLELELQRCPGVGREAFKAIAEYCPVLPVALAQGLPACQRPGTCAFPYRQVHFFHPCLASSCSCAGSYCCPTLLRVLVTFRKDAVSVLVATLVWPGAGCSLPKLNLGQCGMCGECGAH